MPEPTRRFAGGAGFSVSARVDDCYLELALLGILFKLTIAHRFKILSLVTYLAMGWLSLVVIYEMAVKLAAGSVTLLAVGGVVYSLGVIFYVCKRIPYNHAIWHGFVLGGSVCHFLAIYLYIGQA